MRTFRVTRVHWFRRDLRLADNPALSAAAADGDLVAVFCLDESLFAGRHASPRRNAFLRGCLESLAADLTARGSRLVVLGGKPHEEIPRIVAEVGATAVHAHADVGPYARRRDELVAAALGAVPLHLHPGLCALDDLDALRGSTDGPLTIFTPFYRRWLLAQRRPVLEVPVLSSASSYAGMGVPFLAVLGDAPVREWAVGEEAANDRLAHFLATDADNYADKQNQLMPLATSGLSPYLHLGVISPRQIEDALTDRAAHEKFRRQVAWRDFYQYVLLHFPENATLEFQQRFRVLQWRDDDELFAAWCEGRTGYPIIDAAMRQLATEGYLPNRARLIVGSFLTKHLGVDWRLGERWFMRQLYDGDEASNNGNWQWIASVGVDPAPMARRLYNPSLQQDRHDESGAYVRHYCPELAGVPREFLSHPWDMPPLLQVEVGCVIGEDYPDPIVDHAHARREAFERFAAARDEAVDPRAVRR